MVTRSMVSDSYNDNGIIQEDEVASLTNDAISAFSVVFVLVSALIGAIVDLDFGAFVGGDTGVLTSDVDDVVVA